MSRIDLSTVTRFAAVFAVALPMLGIGAVSAASADARAEASPNIAVTLTSDAETLAAGERITYTAEIANKGESLQARVVLMSPTYVMIDAIEGAEVDGNEATWVLALGAAETKTIEIPARIGEIPGAELRATSLLSLYVGDATSPLVRTASPNRIEGVVDEQVVARPGSYVLFWVAGGVGIAIAVFAAGFVMRRRKSAYDDIKPEVGIGGTQAESPPEQR